MTNTPPQSSTPLVDAFCSPDHLSSDWEDFARDLERANAGQAAALKAEQERHQITCEALRDSEHECNVAEQELANLVHDMERLHDSLNGEATARIEAEQQLAEAQREWERKWEGNKQHCLDLVNEAQERWVDRKSVV